MKLLSKKSLFFFGFIIFCLLWIMFLRWAVRSDGFEISVIPTQYMLQSTELECSRGFILSTGENIRLSLSYEGTLLALAEQACVKIKLYGLQVSKRFEVVPNLFFEMGTGYYKPKWRECKSFREAMWLEVNQIYGYHYWSDPDTYQYQLYGNYGGFVNLQYSQEVIKNLSLNFNTGYRFLKMGENLRRSQPQSNSWVEFGRQRDFSGGFVGLGLMWRF